MVCFPLSFLRFQEGFCQHFVEASGGLFDSIWCWCGCGRFWWEDLPVHGLPATRLFELHLFRVTKFFTPSASCGAACMCFCFFCDIVDVFVNQPVDSEEDIPNILNGPVDVLHWHYRSKSCVFNRLWPFGSLFNWKSWQVQVYAIVNPVCFYDFQKPLFCLDHHRPKTWRFGSSNCPTLRVGNAGCLGPGSR